VGLFAIPRAAAGSAEAGHKGDESLETGADAGGRDEFRSASGVSAAFRSRAFRFAGRHEGFQRKNTDE